jgi:hypothetical protein
MIIVHHLNNSRSQRVLWLLEDSSGLHRAATRRFFEPHPRAQRLPARARTRQPVRLLAMGGSFHNTAMFELEVLVE